MFDFSATAGLLPGNLVLLSGNGGGGDGLLVDPTARTLADANPLTVIGVAPTTPPPTTGDRSGYGSVLLVGTFSSLTVDVTRNPGGVGDGGSFTLSLQEIPEPSSLALFGGGAVMCGWVIRTRRRRNAA